MERTRSYGHKLVSILLALLLACSFGLSTGLSYSLAYAADGDTQEEATTTDISTIGVPESGDQFYTGSEVQPFSGSIKISADTGTYRISEGTDYTVEYANNVELGTATATLTGIGDYSGTLTMTFEIVEYTLTVTIGDYEVSFTRAQLEELAANSTDNTEGVAYQYGSNVIYVPAKGYVTYATLLEYVGVGEWTQLVSTASDGFSTTVTADIAENGQFYPASTGSGNTDTTGAESTPGCLCLQWTSGSITSTAGALAQELAKTDASAYETTVRSMTGITAEDFVAGNNSGGNRLVTNVCAIEVTGSLDIASIGISDCGDQYYTGSAIEPFSGSVKSNVGRVYEGEDYTVEYANNTEKGTATATLTGMGDYTGTVTFEFAIIDYTLTVSMADGTVAFSFTRAQLEELAANSTDNTEGVAYQYGSNVLYVPAKGYVTYETLLEAAGCTSWSSLVASASDGFSTTVTADIAENGQFYPASTGSGNTDTTGAESTPGCLCLQWTSGSITSTAGALAQELAKTDASAYETTVRSMTGITEEDFLAGNNSGGNRLVTNVCEITVDEEGAFLSDNITDNDADEWFYEYVIQVVNGGIMEGYRDDEGNLTGIFGVSDNITRGQVATVLWRMAGSPEVEDVTAFSDVDYSLYYGDAIDWARSEEVITGYADTGYTVFDPDKNVTREELATMIARYADKVMGIEVSADVDTTAASELLGWSDVSSWAQDGFAWCVNNGIITGIENADGTYSASPESDTERSMMAAMVIRMLAL